jgi:hypothetical protein
MMHEKQPFVVPPVRPLSMVYFFHCVKKNDIWEFAQLDLFFVDRYESTNLPLTGVLPEPRNETT